MSGFIVNISFLLSWAAIKFDYKKAKPNFAFICRTNIYSLNSFGPLWVAECNVVDTRQFRGSRSRLHPSLALGIPHLSRSSHQYIRRLDIIDIVDIQRTAAIKR